MSKWKASSKKRKQAPASRRDARGRVHLVVQSTPDTPKRLVLSSPLFANAWQDELATATAETVLLGMERGVSAHALVELAHQAMTAVARLSAGFLERAPQAVACSAGCDHCCHQSVGVTPPEALAIVSHLVTHWSEPQLQELGALLRVTRARTQGLSSAARYSPQFPCVFLLGGRCSIYAVRPLSCRGVNALDAAECRVNLYDPDARATYLQTGAGAHSYLEPVRAFHAVSAGLQLGLAQFAELDMRPLELTGAVLLLLSDPDGVCAAWLAGEPVFAEVRGGDSTNDEHVHGAVGTIRP